ncbi:MAG: hypothetical protein JNM28_12060 [Armatimonadetes bacterium]|nr:hypothetical protein [Armatimonadota bacterium]
MRERIVAVLGAGNMRTAPLVSATLARWYPDVPFGIRLFDANPERLDLADLLLRRLLDDWNDEIPVASSQSATDALDGATEVIVTMHEDCARRMTSRGWSPNLEYFESANTLDLYGGGDRNRPTPVEQLSEQTRRLLENPGLESGSREDAIRESMAQILEIIPEEARLLSLTRGVLLPVERPYAHFDWPPPVAEMGLQLVPHQILRWVRGDEKIEPLAQAADASPVMAWLKDSEAG